MLASLLSSVSAGVILISIALNFGHMSRYYVKLEVTNMPAPSNAFTVFMSSQQQISTQCFLLLKESQQNKKKELNKAVQSFLRSICAGHLLKLFMGWLQTHLEL